MKKILFLMVVLPMMLFTACSSDDEDNPQTQLTQSALIGKWSTGIDGVHKYIDFEADGTGFYTLYNGATMGQNYMFSYTISDNSISIKITYSESDGLIGKNKLWNCTFWGNKLKIDNETENGIYNKIE